jgi:hypothetical protein
MCDDKELPYIEDVCKENPNGLDKAIAAPLDFTGGKAHVHPTWRHKPTSTPFIPPSNRLPEDRFEVARLEDCENVD